MPKKYTVSVDAPDKLIGAGLPDLKPMDEAQLTNVAKNLLDTHAQSKLKMSSGAARKTWADNQVASSGLKQVIRAQTAVSHAVFDKYAKLEVEMQGKMGFALNNSLQKIVDEFKAAAVKATAAQKSDLDAAQKKMEAALRGYIDKLKA
jgi:hypothetical protein